MVTRGGHPSGHSSTDTASPSLSHAKEKVMTNIVYIVGVIVIVVAILSFFGLR
jgi:acid phosphatase family membrane protein YuiD